MNTVTGVGLDFNKARKLTANNVVNFQRNEKSAIKDEDSYDIYIREQQKNQKSAKRQQTFNTVVMALIAAASVGSLGFLAHQAGWFKKFKVPFKDIAGEKGLAELALPDSQKQASERIVNRIEHYFEIIKKGGKKGSSILFYGPPGTGKNTFAYAIAKKFPNAKFVEMDISKMNSMWHGESEKNALGLMEAVVKYAKKHNGEKIFVFIDEIDSVMMKDAGANGKLSNDMLNAFKKGFNQLANQENIIVIGATNLKIDPKLARAEGKVLDTAMLDRFAQKVLVDLPTKEQLLEGINIFYNNPKLEMIDSALKDIKDARWDKIADFLSDHNRETSFRKLNAILGTAAEETKIGKDITFENIINAIKEHQHDLHVSDLEMEEFINSMK